MGSKNKTVSFRVDEDTFESLRDIADERDLSLSAVFRDYVDELVAHDGKVEIVPEGGATEAAGDEPSFPPRVEVPKSFVRDHERLELEADHLREQLEEHKRYIRHLQRRLESEEDVEEVVSLEDLDRSRGREGATGREADREFESDEELYRLG
ncbi:MAG: ribbon-helix-helix protein, CopG family [Halobacteriaceae archaeon]